MRSIYIYLLSQMKYDWNTGSEQVEEIPQKIVLTKSRKRERFQSHAAVTRSNSSTSLFSVVTKLPLCNTILWRAEAVGRTKLPLRVIASTRTLSSFPFSFFYPGIRHEREISQAVAHNFRGNRRNRRPREDSSSRSTLRLR